MCSQARHIYASHEIKESSMHIAYLSETLSVAGQLVYNEVYAILPPQVIIT